MNSGEQRMLEGPAFKATFHCLGERPLARALFLDVTLDKTELVAIQFGS